MFCPYKKGKALYLECQECDTPICEYFFCMVVGSRTFHNYEMLQYSLDYLLQKKAPNVVIVSGGAKGADQLAERYAKEKGYHFEVFPADWEKYGKCAGIIRNREMQEYISKMQNQGIVAFWNGVSKGTASNFPIAKQLGIQIKVIRYEKGE